jgi:hypothetical protein
MGLTVYYELSLPGSTSDEAACQFMERLRNYACSLAPGRLTALIEHSLTELLEKRTLPWAGLDAHFHAAARCNLDEASAALADADHDRRSVVGFNMHPGRGCEALALGLMRPGLTVPPEDVQLDGPWDVWYWHFFCKTQYASVVSNDHLIRCHLMVVQMLEEAARLGATVEVRDDTGYWTHRSTEQLIREVDRMNEIVARIAGAFHDAMPADSENTHRVEGAIFEHPDFERLETKGGAGGGG